MCRRALCILLLLIVPVTCSYSQTWELFGNLSEARRFFQVERIGDTKFIIMGGSTVSDKTNTCEILDAESGTIVRAASMNARRTLFGSAALPDGRIIVAGDAKEIEIYDPYYDTWTVVGEMIDPYSQSTLTLIDDHRIIIIGGWTTNNCEIFDITTGETIKTANFPYETSQAKAFTTSDGRVFSFGGRSGGPGSFRSDQVHEYLPDESRWVVSGQSAGRLYLPTITKTYNGQIVWTGGSFSESNSSDNFSGTVALFEDGSFYVIGQMANVRVGHGSADLFDENNSVIVVGGMDNNKRAMRNCEIIDLSSGDIYQGPTLNFPHGYFTAVSVQVGCDVKVFAISGTDGNRLIPQVEVLTIPSSNASSGYISIQNSNINLLGSARLEGKRIFLTDTAQFSAGAAWLKGKVRVSPSFGTNFSFRMQNGNDNALQDGGPKGADGVALVIQNQKEYCVGAPGQGIGYDNCPHGIAIEFDSFLNAENLDPSTSHSAVQIGDGTRLRSSHQAQYVKAIDYSRVPRLRSDGTEYFARVLYESGILSVWLDTLRNFSEPIFSVPIDLNSELQLDASGTAYFGLTSATGYSVETHEISSWSLEGCRGLLTSIWQNEDNNDEENLFDVIPNPITTESVIKFNKSTDEGVQVEMFDMRGVLVWSTMKPGSVGSVMIPTHSLSGGLYVIKASSGLLFDSKIVSVIH